MTLFDLAPKETPAALFGRDQELDELSRYVAAGRWVVLLGPRMVGKTSLAKAVRRKAGLPGAYVNLWGVNSVKGLVEGLIRGFNDNPSLRTRLARAARRLEGFGVGPAGISLSTSRPKLSSVWDLLNLLGEEAGASLVVLDEVQELSASSGRLLKLLGNLFNTQPRVRFIFTGSLVGVSRTLVQPEGSSPLVGRSPVSITLAPFGHETAARFLRSGLRESTVRISDAEINSVLDGPLDGTPGWLTLFGNHLTVRNLSPARALEETIREGRRVAADELRHLLRGRDGRLYWSALRALAAKSSWSEVRGTLEQDLGRPVNDATVQRVLRALEASFLARKIDSRYDLIDPMVRSYVLSAPRRLPSGLRT